MSAQVTNSKTTDFDRDTIVVLPLSEIEVNHQWNSRSSAAVLADGDGGEKESSGFKGLIESIKSGGQDTPVDVIRNVKGAKQPYFLTAGFRRTAAIVAIAAEKKDANPRIRAVVRELSPAEARLYNLRENTAREQLTGADLAKGIEELIKLDATMTTAKLVAALNKSQTYLDKHKKINDNIPAKIRAHWRDTPGNPVTVTQMYGLAILDAVEIEPGYWEMYKQREEGEAGKPGDWHAAAKKRASKMGQVLGELQRDHMLEVSECHGNFQACIRTLVLFPECTKKEQNAVAKACSVAFESALQAEEQEEEEPTE